MTKIQCQIVLEWAYVKGDKGLGISPAWCLFAGGNCLAYIEKQHSNEKWTFGGSMSDNVGASVCESVLAKSRGIKCLTSCWDEAELPQLKQMVVERVICDLESRG